VTGRSLAQGKVEVVKRADKTSVEIPIAELVSTLKAWIAEAVK
jgi:prolyl-tRNA synthetase